MTAVTANILDFQLDCREFPAPKKGLRGMLSGAFTRVRDTVVGKVAAVKNTGVQIGRLAKTAVTGDDLHARKGARKQLGKIFVGVAASVAQNKAKAAVLGAVVSTVGLPAVLIGAGLGAGIGVLGTVYLDYRRYKRNGVPVDLWSRSTWGRALKDSKLRSVFMTVAGAALGAALGAGASYGMHSLMADLQQYRLDQQLVDALRQTQTLSGTLPSLDSPVSFAADMPSILDKGSHFADTPVFGHGDLSASSRDLANNYTSLQYDSRVRPYSFALFDANAQPHAPLTPAPAPVVVAHDVPVMRPEDAPRPALSTAELERSRAESLKNAQAWAAAQTHLVPDTIPAAAPSVTPESVSPAPEPETTSAIPPRHVTAHVQITDVDGAQQVATTDNAMVKPGETVTAEWKKYQAAYQFTNTGKEPVSALDLVMNKMCGDEPQGGEFKCDASGLDASGLPKVMPQAVAQLAAAAP